MKNYIISDKKLLSEIKRIGELISPDYDSSRFIITEQLGQTVDEIISKYSDRVGELFGFTSKKNYSTIVTSLKKIYDKSDNVVKRLTPDDTVETLKSVFPNLSLSAKKTMVELIIKYSNEKIDNALVDIVTRILGISTQDLIRYAKAYPNDEKGFVNSIFPADTPEYLKSFITRFWKKVNGIGDVLSQDEIRKLADYVQTKGGTTFLSDITKSWGKSLDDITNKVRTLSDEYLSKVESGTFGSEQMTEITNAYALAVARQMNMMEMNMEDGARKVLELSDMDEVLKDKILNGTEDIFVLFRKLRSGESGIVKGTKEKIDELLNSVSLKLSDPKLFGLRYPKLKVSPDFRQYFFTGQWAFLSDFYKKAVQKSAFSNPKQMIAYVGALAMKSIWGAAFAAAVMAALVTLWIEVKWKETVNFVWSKFGANPPYENPEEGRSECDGVISALGDTYLRLLTEYVDNGRLLIPLVGTIEVSPAGMITKILTGKDKVLFGVDDVQKESEDNLLDQSNEVPLPDTGELPPIIDDGNQGNTNQGNTNQDTNQDTNQGGF